MLYASYKRGANVQFKFKIVKRYLKLVIGGQAVEAQYFAPFF